MVVHLQNMLWFLLYAASNTSTLPDNFGAAALKVGRLAENEQACNV